MTFALCLAAALLTAFTTPATAQSSSGYVDVEGAHAAAIRAVTEAGVAQGCTKDRFCPDDPVRRDQMASFLAQALDLEQQEGSRFVDVSEQSPHAGAVYALAEAGVTSGCGENRFCPDAAVNRAQMATFLAAAFDLAPPEYEYFQDVGAPHANAAQRLGEAGISGGCDILGLSFCPGQQVRRDQMASFLGRAMDLVEGPSIPVFLRPGDEGAHVEALQQRLLDHDYWIGSTDGVYGTVTEHAVLALQKVHGLARDGIYGPNTRRAVADPEPPATETDSGYVVEFDENRQLVLLVQDGAAQRIFHASGGDERYYDHEGTTYWAETPNGRWEIYRQIDGWRTSHLGELYRPKYFHRDGIAFHGFPEVPPQAASHGCVRLSMKAMDWVWTNDAMPIGTQVLVYGSPG